ncbi:MAG: HAD family hydrolase [Syntrophomonadaceae bacterium]|jgi:phosphoglycolate phosphatase|nr:HAD family hydrolase [Syntrophomonadaceae bacterium]
MIKLCVFDLDGTLVNSLEDLAASTNYALIKNGFPPRQIHEFPYLIGDGVLILLQRAMGEIYQEEQVQQLLEDFDYYYNGHYADLTRPYAGCVELLRDLQEEGLQLAVLSNKPDRFTKIIVEEMFPDITFARIKGKSEHYPTKPDPASLNSILEELQLAPEQALYIGDTNVDVLTAHNAGIKIAGAAWGFRGREELRQNGADYLIESPHEIKNLIKQIS